MPAERDYSTVAGFALSVLKKIPDTGEVFKFDGYRFEVVDMDGRKIDKLLVNRTRRRRDEERGDGQQPSAATS
jgi:putative hemolysin